jgi:transposase
VAFREVSVVQVREALRRWLNGDGERPIARQAGIDRKTARRYIVAAMELGVSRDGDESQLTDELVGQVCERVRPRRPDGHGDNWRVLVAHEEQIKKWVKADHTVVKIGILLARRGVDVPHGTLARFAVERCGAGRRHTTVRVDDPAPRRELQVDFGRLGLVADGERRRSCWALIFTAVVSRHQFVWPTFAQTTEATIAGFEAAWHYFGGVFPVVIPDSMKALVEEADNTAPRLNDTFMEHAQSRGFGVDPARIGTPTDKPRVERAVPYVRRNFFVGCVWQRRRRASLVARSPGTTAKGCPWSSARALRLVPPATYTAPAACPSSASTPPATPLIQIARAQTLVHGHCRCIGVDIPDPFGGPQAERSAGRADDTMRVAAVQSGFREAQDQRDGEQEPS